MSRWSIIPILLISVTLAGAAMISAASSMSGDPECEAVGQQGYEICGAFMSHWENNGGIDVLGEPLSEQVEEIDPVTQELLAVQYFEYARLEHHPDLDDTPYAVQAGRLGAELLSADGIEWTDLPSADPDLPFYAQQTGQAIAPEFQDYWSEHGLDLGDDGVSFRESVALFGYPISPAEEVGFDDGTTLVQWFERARLELDSSGDVRSAPLGAEADDSSERLSLRAEREIDTTLTKIHADHGVPGLGVWLDAPALGAFEWSHGSADPDSEQPYTLETHHRIGSVTKPVVGNVVLQLVDEGWIDLDDTVERWFPELNGATEVTIRMLATMTSGIFNYTEVMAWASEMFSDPDRVWEPEELLEYGFRMTEIAEPDGTWSYSNTNYIMLGMIIEDVTGNDLADELQTRIFDPLDLTSTSFPLRSDASLPEPFASAESIMGLGSSPRDSTGWNPSWAWAAGQVVSIPADMIAWAPELYDSRLLSEEMAAVRLDLVDVIPEEAREELPEMRDAGYGIGVLHDRGWYAHDGLISGYTSMVAYNPELDASLVIFANSDALSGEYTLATSVAYEQIRQILAREYLEIDD